MKLILFFYLAYSADANRSPGLSTEDSPNGLLSPVKHDTFLHGVSPIELDAAEESVELLEDFFTKILFNTFSNICLDAEVFYKHSDEEMNKEVPESISKIIELKEQLKIFDRNFFGTLLKNIYEICNLFIKKSKNIIDHNELDNNFFSFRTSIDNQKTLLDNFQKACISWIDSAISDFNELIKSKCSFEENIKSLENSNSTLLSLFDTNQKEKTESPKKEEKKYIFTTHYFSRAFCFLSRLRVNNDSCSFDSSELSLNWETYGHFRFYHRRSMCEDFDCFLRMPFNDIISRFNLLSDNLIKYKIFDFSKVLFSKRFEVNKSGLENFLKKSQPLDSVKVES